MNGQQIKQERLADLENHRKLYAEILKAMYAAADDALAAATAVGIDYGTAELRIFALVNASRCLLDYALRHRSGQGASQNHRLDEDDAAYVDRVEKMLETEQINAYPSELGDAYVGAVGAVARLDAVASSRPAATPKQHKQKPRGRPRRSEERKARQAEIAAKWNDFYGSKCWQGKDGTPKVQFCQQEGIPREELDTALRRDSELRSKSKL